MRVFGFIAICWSLMACQPEAPSWQKKQLIAVEELVQSQKKGMTFSFIDVRPLDKFVEGHLPEARNIWRPQMESKGYPYGGMMASNLEMQALFQELGIANEDWCVLYDASGQVDAARLWWILDAYGYKKVALLDGGIQAYKRANLELESGKPRTWPRSAFQLASSMSSQHWTSKDEISDKDYEFQLIDCRSEEEYMGSFIKDGAYRAGHIPNAVRVDFTECLNIGGENDCTFKSTEELNAVYIENGVSPDKTVIVYCHSGVRSAHSTFVLTRLLGYSDVRNYDGSWVEWSYFPELPIESSEQ